MAEFLVGGALCSVFGLDRASRTHADCMNSDQQVPYIYLLHGRNEAKARVHNLALKMANELSFPAICITFDLPNHGDRVIDPARNGTWMDGNFTHASDMYTQMLETTHIISNLIDCLALQLPPFARPKCHSVIGISMGGHTVLLAMTNEPRISCGVSFISSGDYFLGMQLRYESLEKFYAKNGTSKNKQWAFQELVPQNLINLIDEYDPIRNLDRLTGHPIKLLIINGDADKLVQKECNLKLMGKLDQMELADDVLIEHKLLPGIKHEVNEDMQEMALEFFEKHLISNIANIKSSNNNKLVDDETDSLGYAYMNSNTNSKSRAQPSHSVL